MSDVEFIEEQNQSIQGFRSHQLLGELATPAAVKFLMKAGVAKNQKSAYYVMLSVIIVCFLLSGYIMAVYVFHVDFSGFSLLPKPAAVTPIIQPPAGTSKDSPGSIK